MRLSLNLTPKKAIVLLLAALILLSLAGMVSCKGGPSSSSKLSSVPSKVVLAVKIDAISQGLMFYGIESAQKQATLPTGEEVWVGQMTVEYRNSGCGKFTAPFRAEID